MQQLRQELQSEQERCSRLQQQLQIGQPGKDTADAAAQACVPVTSCSMQTGMHDPDTAVGVAGDAGDNNAGMATNLPANACIAASLCIRMSESRLGISNVPKYMLCLASLAVSVLLSKCQDSAILCMYIASKTCSCAARVCVYSMCLYVCQDVYVITLQCAWTYRSRLPWFVLSYGLEASMALAVMHASS